MSNYTRWYRDGTIGATNGSTEITGSGTYWNSAGLNPGDMLEVDNSGVLLEIASINSDTSITLARPYSENTVTDAAYAIVRNFTATMPSKIAAQTAELLGDFRKYIDTDMDRLTGKSAYEIAKLHGFTGTEAAWLESLKAAGEWTTLNNRTQVLTSKGPMLHNALVRNRNLNSFTSSYFTAIGNNDFSNVYPGDYCAMNTSKGRFTIYVMGCNLHPTMTKPHVVLWLIPWGGRWNYPINDTDTLQGHFLNSKMYTEYFPEMIEEIKEIIPEEYLLSWMESVGSSIDSAGNVNYREAVQVQMGIPSYRNITGGAIDLNHQAYSFMGSVVFPWAMHNQQFINNFRFHFIGESYDANNWCTVGWTCYGRYGVSPSRTQIVHSADNIVPNTLMPYIMVGVN